MRDVSRDARCVLVSLCALLSAVVALLLASTPALALNTRVIKGSFGSAGSGAGQFEGPSGVAVEEVALGQVGDVYAVDQGNNRVEWFSPEGKEFKGEFDGHETPAGSFVAPTSIAVDNSTNPLDPSAGDVYVVDSGHKVVDKFEAGGKYAGSITTGSGGEPLGELDGVAVDPEGLVWIYQGSGEIDSYSSAIANEFLASRSSPFGVSPGFAVDAEDNLYVNRGAEVVGKINSSGEVLIEELDNEGSTAAAVDTATNEVFVDNITSVAVFDAAPACTAVSPCVSAPSSSLLDRFGTGHLEHGSGVAVDASSDVAYVADSIADTVRVFTPALVPDVTTGLASNPGEGAVTLNGTVNPDGVQVTSCEFEYGPTTAYGSTAECAANPGAGSSPVAVSAEVSGLQLGYVYHYRLLAGNKNGTNAGADRTFQAGASIEGESVSRVGSTEVGLTANIGAAALPTTYRVEYGATTAYGFNTPTVSIGAPTDPVAVAVRLEGLEPGAPYHYRFVASDGFGDTQGPDQTFVTSLPSASAQLPDHRAFELVSSASANADVYPPWGQLAPPDVTQQLVRAAADGDSVAYQADPPPEGGAGDTGARAGNQYIAKRTAHDWALTPLQLAVGTRYQYFSGDLGTGIMNPEAFAGREKVEVPAANPPAPAGCMNNPLFSYTPEDAAYRSLLSRTPADEPVECRTEFAGSNAGTATVAPSMHVLLQGSFKLTQGAFEETPYLRYNLYDSVGGELHLVSILPDGESTANARFVGTPVSRVREIDVTETDGEADSTITGTPDDISADGSRVFWTEVSGSGVEEPERELFVRENDTQSQSPIAEGGCAVPADACTLQLDLTQPGAEGPSGGGQFLAASRDGSKVYFTDVNRLTSGSHASAGEPDLYEYELDREGGRPGRLVDLTPGEHADVEGMAAMTEDGETLYFVAGGVLTSGQNVEGREPVAGQPNLYLLHRGETVFIATLSPLDNHESSNTEGLVGDWSPDAGRRTAEATPDGQNLVFRSERPLTGYENRGLREVFVFDAKTRTINCVSCDPAGAPPTTHVSNTYPVHQYLYDEGAFLQTSFDAEFQPRWMSSDGARVFFETGQPLVPQDVNGLQDVYEWERPASGSETDNTCSRSSRSFSEVDKGCVYLLSGITNADDAYFVDASENGDDVFLMSRGKLAPGAGNENMALYDVRVDGGFPEPALACTGTGCQGVPPAPPRFATPASVTFAGTGNYAPQPPSSKPTSSRPTSRTVLLTRALKACRAKHGRRKRAACESAARRRYGPKHLGKRAKRTSNDRRSRS